MTLDEAKSRYGFDPETIGCRHRSWHVVEAIEWEEQIAGAQVGDLCVCARDGADNPPDPHAFCHPNYRGTAQDSFDCTYRYYYYAPLEVRADAHA